MLVKKNDRIDYIESTIKRYQKINKKGIRVLETGIGFYDHGGFTGICSKIFRSQDILDTIDISLDHIKSYTARFGEQNNIFIHHTDSVDFINKTKNFYDLVFLDSVNCKDHIFKEFLGVMKKIKPGSVIIVDDSGLKSHGHHKPDSYKGLRVHKYCVSNKIEVQIPCWNVISIEYKDLSAIR
jgi:hypothetical protein